VIFDAARTRGKSGSGTPASATSDRWRRRWPRSSAPASCSRCAPPGPRRERLRAGLERLGLASAASLAAGEEAIASAVPPGLAMPATGKTSLTALARRRLLAIGFVADRRMQRILARPLAAPLQRHTGRCAGRRGGPDRLT